MNTRYLSLLFLTLLAIGSVSCGGGSDGGTAPEPDPKPEVTGLTPNEGPVGTAVTIMGKNFSATATDNSVSFNGTTAEIASASATEIHTSVPGGASSGAVEVTVNGESATGPAFTVKEKAPGIRAVEPDSARTGDAVTIKGMNFSSTPAENVLSFNGVEAIVDQATDTTLSATVPGGDVTGAIQVTTHSQTATGPIFTLLPPAPVINSLSPDTVAVGEWLSILGEELGSSSFPPVVHIGDMQVEVKDTSKTELRLLVPDGAADGTVHVTVAGLTADSPNNFVLKTTGKLNLETVTTGQTMDPDGYTISVSGLPDRPIGINETLTLPRVEEGTYDIALSGIAPNCSAKGGVTSFNGLTITAGRTHTVRFELSCKRVLKNKIVFSGRDSQGSKHLYEMNPDGSGRAMIGDMSYAYDLHPAVSPDGTRIAFASRAGYQDPYRLHIINADGTGLTEIDSGNYIGFVSWSPDGTRLVYSMQSTSDNQVRNIFRINTEGTNKVNLTNDSNMNRAPSWSPDGQKIAYSSFNQIDTKLYTMNPDGTNIQPLTGSASGTAENQPSWSPGGNRIAYSFDNTFSGADDNLAVWSTVSGSRLQLTSNSYRDQRPRWSPDGSRLVFESYRNSSYSIFIVPADGSATPQELSVGITARFPYWSPVQ